MPVFDVFSVPFFVLFVFNSILAFLNFTLCEQVGSENVRLRMLRILDVFSEPCFLLMIRFFLHLLYLTL